MASCVVTGAGGFIGGHLVADLVRQGLDVRAVDVKPLDRWYQGPFADSLTHIGQLTMLRRLSGAPMKGEAYFYADITPGRVGPDQAPADPKYEFD